MSIDPGLLDSGGGGNAQTIAIRVDGAIFLGLNNLVTRSKFYGSTFYVLTIATGQLIWSNTLVGPYQGSERPRQTDTKCFVP